MIRQNKEALVERLRHDVNQSIYITVLVFEKNSMLTLEDLRRSLREYKASLFFVKRSLLPLVFKDSAHSVLMDNDYHGVCAIVFSETPFVAEECLKKSRVDEGVRLYCMSSSSDGLMCSGVVNVFSRCQDSKQLYGMLLGMLKSPIARLTSVLHQYVQSQS